MQRGTIDKKSRGFIVWNVECRVLQRHRLQILQLDHAGKGLISIETKTRPTQQEDTSRRKCTRRALGIGPRRVLRRVAVTDHPSVRARKKIKELCKTKSSVTEHLLGTKGPIQVLKKSQASQIMGCTSSTEVSLRSFGLLCT